jgi:hypothetical protein
VLTLQQCEPDEGESDEGAENHIKLVVTGEDTAEALEATEESFDMIALSINRLV